MRGRADLGGPGDVAVVPCAAVASVDELERFRRGDAEGVRAVYREYGGPVFAVAPRAVGARDLAGGGTQHPCVKAWRAAAGFDADRELGPWLATIARRTAIDIHRREARRSTSPLDDVRADDPAVIDLPPGIDRAYDAWAVRAAIDALPDDEREI